MSVKEIVSNLYKIEVPLPKNPLGYLNSYIIKSPERNLVIDTGLPKKECQEVMQDGLAELGVDLDKTDFFVTHVHADHTGLLPYLATKNSLVYAAQPDADVVRDGGDWESMGDFTRLNGFPGEFLEMAIKKHPGYNFSGGSGLTFSIVDDGSLLTYGEYRLTCIKTPGHSEGHMTLYDQEKKIYFSGDHLLAEITPNISLASPGINPLKDYFNSLDKIYDLDFDLVLPGHRRFINNHRERINELKHHHKERLEEILSILKTGDMTAFDVAAHMSWDLDCKSWQDFPLAQKWFATAEAAAHLKYMEVEGLLYNYLSKDRMFYQINKNILKPDDRLVNTGTEGESR